MPLSRRRVVAAVVLLVAFIFCLPVADLAFDGPYVTRFNRELARRAADSTLVGKPEREVLRILGPPDRLDRNPVAYVYYPYPFVPVSQVKVYCEGGIVTGVKQFDD